MTSSWVREVDARTAEGLVLHIDYEVAESDEVIEWFETAYPETKLYVGANSREGYNCYYVETEAQLLHMKLRFL